jgi:polar amino acid transport system substrate-binding protein
LGVPKGSSSQSVLGTKLDRTTIVGVDSLEQAQRMLTAGELDGFATNKGILFELNARLNGFKVLDDRWGLENLAIAIPKGRSSAMPFLLDFTRRQRQTGSIDAYAQRSGLRGIAKD